MEFESLEFLMLFPNFVAEIENGEGAVIIHLDNGEVGVVLLTDIDLAEKYVDTVGSFLDESVSILAINTVAEMLAYLRAAKGIGATLLLIDPKEISEDEPIYRYAEIDRVIGDLESNAR